MEKRSMIISLYSPSGGGKTTVARVLAEKMPNAKALYFDDRDYDSDSGIVDLRQWYDDGADVNRFDLRLFASDIEQCIEEGCAYVFLDYPFGYRHELISQYLDLSIFIDTPLDIALARRLLRDYKGKTAKEILSDTEFYLQKERAVYLHGEKMVRNDADVIIDGSLALEEIVGKISDKLEQLKVRSKRISQPYQRRSRWKQ